MNRRELLQAAVAAPLAVAVERAPLLAKELALLAYASPDATGVLFNRDTDERATLVESLAERGYLIPHPDNWDPEAPVYYIRSPKGDEAIRHLR